MRTKLLIFTLIISTTSIADNILGVYVGINHWNYDMSGNINSSSNILNQVDIDFTKNNTNIFYAALEHSITFLPNIKLQQNSIQSTGIITINDIPFFPDQSIDVNADLDFSHIDIMLYYEVADNWLNLDIGFSLKDFDGHTFFYAENLLDDRSDFDDWIPMLYAKGKFDLPITGVSASATLEALSFDSNNITDLAVEINYENDTGFGAEIGYRSLMIDLDNIGNLKSDLTMDGLYLGVNFHF